MEIKQIKKGDPNPYLIGSKNYNNFEAWSSQPEPNKEDIHLCNRETNSSAPCKWSKTDPIEDVCFVCKKQFPSW